MSEKNLYEVVSPIAHQGSRFEAGSKIELTEEEAHNYGDLVKPVESEAGEETVEATPETEGGEGTSEAGENSQPEGESAPEGEGSPAEGEQPEGEGGEPKQE